jgi:hypothetical protein
MRRIPAYCVHKGRNLAYITVEGREHYLGRAHSPESHARYREALSALAAGLQPRSTLQGGLLSARGDPTGLPKPTRNIADLHGRRRGRTSPEIAKRAAAPGEGQKMKVA